MDSHKIRKLLENVRNNEMGVEEAFEKLKHLPYEDLGFAKIDNHRALRRGFPEVVFCEGKTVEQVRIIFEKMNGKYELLLGMRATEEMYEAVRDINSVVSFNKEARAIIFGKIPSPIYKGLILVVSAGTADMPVAQEAALTAEAMGNKVHRIFDAGVAGIHRILDKRDILLSANVLIVVAGMEGALPGIIAGLTDKPVIAVPTSIGYGASFNGLSALLTMLNSCVPGISVVNIDNGFGAGYTASLINKLSGEKE